MKKYICGLLGVVILSISFAKADEGGYNITKYDTYMNLRNNASMDINETIDVNFSEPRRGIFRQIPVIDPEGKNISISNLDAQNDPIADNSIVDGYYTLKIGSASKTILGQHTYNISYTVNNAIKAYAGSGQNSGWTELYRNILGGTRQTTVSGVSFAIKLPKSYIFASGNMFLVYGKKGDRLTDGASIYQSGDMIYGNINKILDPNTSATVGLKFPSDYFAVSKDYDNYFNKDTNSENNGPGLMIGFLFGAIRLLIFSGGITQVVKYTKINKNGYRKSDKSVTIYYKPPENISPSEAFYFWYNGYNNPKIFTAIIYYRCSRGRTTISKSQGDKRVFGLLGRNDDVFHITENTLKPSNTDEIDDILMQSFFGSYDANKDDRVLDEDAYNKVENLLTSLKNHFTKNNKYFNSKINIYSLFGGSDKLLPEGEILHEQMRGFKEYLLKVEKPVLQKELETNPEFFNTIIPRAVLFGVETKILEAAENILSQVQRYNSYDGTMLNLYAFSAMSSSINTSAISPSTDSSGSGFGGGGGFSGGGGGGGGGGSR